MPTAGPWWRSTEGLAFAVSMYFALAFNGPFLMAAMAGRGWAQASTWAFGAAMLVALVALHWTLLVLVLGRRWAKPVLSVLIVNGALASYYMQRYGVYIDPSMLRNVLHTHAAEASELLGVGLLSHLLVFAVLPLAVLWRVPLPGRPLRRRLVVRAGVIGLSSVMLLTPLLLEFQAVSALMRNHKELRYLITPANLVYSTGRLLVGEARATTKTRAPVGVDAHLAAPWSGHAKPALFVIVVGETARAANWGLNGYTRQTTPELSRLGVLNFPDMQACGTNTETSLPCMFSAVGRRRYDEDRIRHSESLLHVLHRAGFDVQWRDNQSGCKGVCEGLPEQRLDARAEAGCDGARCLDEVLLNGLDTVARDARGNLVVVLHMLGNHGPSYHRRYPADYQRFRPACANDDLARCGRAEIVNAYDNAMLYTDHVLAGVVRFLDAQQGRYDTGMLYVSDHGESLGESGLYLHGMPYAIAPREQLRVPMVWWLSGAFRASFGLDAHCLAAQTAKPWSHDHLFHTVLGLLQVQTSVYEPSLDISAACRR